MNLLILKLPGIMYYIYDIMSNIINIMEIKINMLVRGILTRKGS